MTAPPTDTAVAPPDLEFVDDLPPVRVKGDNVRAALEARPGELARISRGVTRGQATGRANAINRGTGRWAPRGRYKASIRQDDGGTTWSVFAQYVAPEATP